MSTVIPDASTSLGKRMRDRLSREIVIWLTTIGADGTPQPNPVWFLWDGEDTILTYNRSTANRVTHVRSRPRVSLNFDGNGQGGDIMVFTGDAELLPDFPPAHENRAYTEKYAERLRSAFNGPEDFAAKYPIALRIKITRAR